MTGPTGGWEGRNTIDVPQMPGPSVGSQLGQFAQGGAGAVFVEATAVEKRGRITHGCLGLYNDHTEAALARMLAAARSVGPLML